MAGAVLAVPPGGLAASDGEEASGNAQGERSGVMKSDHATDARDMANQVLRDAAKLNAAMAESVEPEPDYVQAIRRANQLGEMVTNVQATTDAQYATLAGMRRLLDRAMRKEKP